MKVSGFFWPNGDPMNIINKGLKGSMYARLVEQTDYKLQWSYKIIAILGMAVIIAVLAVVYAYVSTGFKAYVVRVNDVTGRVETVSELKATSYSPREAEIKYFLSTFINDIRSVGYDPVLWKHNHNRAQHFLTQAAAQKLNALLTQEGIRSKIGKETVMIRVTSVQQQPGTEATYQVRWREERFSAQGGAPLGKDEYVGLFNCALYPPTHEAEFLINPLGLVIVDLNYSREAVNVK